MAGGEITSNKPEFNSTENLLKERLGKEECVTIVMS